MKSNYKSPQVIAEIGCNHKGEIEIAKDIFKSHNWPTIDVTRKSVEETAASIIKIYDIIHSK